MQVSESLFNILMTDLSKARKIKKTGYNAKSPYWNLKYHFSYCGTENIFRSNHSQEMKAILNNGRYSIIFIYRLCTQDCTFVQTWKLMNFRQFKKMSIPIFSSFKSLAYLTVNIDGFWNLHRRYRKKHFSLFKRKSWDLQKVKIFFKQQGDELFCTQSVLPCNKKKK